MNIRKFLYILIMCSAFVACDKMPANGDLDGQWQVIEIEHNGITTNVSQNQIYMSIQLKLVQLGDTIHPTNYYGYFEHNGDSISFWQFSRESPQTSDADDNEPLKKEEEQILHEWGFYGMKEDIANSSIFSKYHYYPLKVSYKVEELTKDLLILRNDSSTIHYIKF